MKFINRHYKLILFSIPVISFILHFHVFNLDLVGIHVWRQTETETVINNFYKEDFNIFFPKINTYADTDRLHRMEFPIMQWLFALGFKIFGQHIAVTRTLSFITGLFSVFGIYYLAERIFKNKTTAVIAAWCFNFSPVFYYYTMNPMPDDMALACSIWSIGLLYAYTETKKIKYLLLSSLLFGAGILIKLPFICYSVFLMSFVFIKWKNSAVSLTHFLSSILLYAVFTAPAAAWYAWVIPTWHNGTVKGIFDAHQNWSELIYFLFGVITSVLPELIINYGAVVFFIAGFYFLIKYKIYRSKYFPAFFIQGSILILYLLYEINMITTVHDYYLLPYLPFIFIVVAYGAFCLLSSGKKFIRIFSIVCLCILPATAFIRADSRWKTDDPGFNVTYYRYKDELRNLTPQNAYCITGNDVSSYILLYYINRKGWAFSNDQLDENQLSYYISKGARYLFIDDHIDENPGIKKHLAEKIFDKESVRVYKLK